MKILRKHTTKSLVMSFLFLLGGNLSALAQAPILPPDSLTPPQQDLEPDPSLIEEDEELPRLEELFPQDQASPSSDESVPVPENAAIAFTSFRLIGSMAFDDEELTAVIQERVHEQFPLPSDRDASFSEIRLISQAVYDYYRENNYLLAGLAVVRVDENKVLVLQAEEWEIANIEVSGLQRLRSSYVSSRLSLAIDIPVDVGKLQDALRLLQSDPLIETFDATLIPGIQPDEAVLRIEVDEASTFAADFNANNNRSESIGSTERGVQLREGNLLGFGDGLTLSYDNTDGSNSFTGRYTIPITPRDTTLSLSYATSDSEIIQPPFDVFDIQSTSRYYDLTLRHPIVRTPEQELALGMTLSRWETKSEFLEGTLGQAVPLQTLGSDEQGRTRLSVIRFTQDWTQRDRNSALALRSQFNVGLDAFDSTINEQAPDSRFFSWQGQGQYVRRIAPDTLLLLRGNVQFADRPLVPLEQFALGGVSTVRGYRRDAVTTDNGALFSAELRIPILRVPELGNGLLQVAPFIDVGWAWNNGDLEPTADLLAAKGLGLRWRSDAITASLDYGIPLTNTANSFGDSSLRFSLSISPF